MWRGRFPALGWAVFLLRQAKHRPDKVVGFWAVEVEDMMDVMAVAAVLSLEAGSIRANHRYGEVVDSLVN